MSAEPPFELGALHESETWLLPALAPSDCGAEGAVAGALGVAGASFEESDSPTALLAFTR